MVNKMHTNPNAYNHSPTDRTRKLVVTVKLDSVPGWGHIIEDHINLMTKANPYIITVEEVDNA